MNEKDREDFIIMKSDIQHTKESLEKIEVNSDRLNKEFNKLMFHLVGDKDTNTKGWIEKITKFDVRLSALEKAYAIGAGLVSAILMYIKFGK